MWDLVLNRACGNRIDWVPAGRIRGLGKECTLLLHLAQVQETTGVVNNSTCPFFN
jgi:hypothetical protein